MFCGADCVLMGRPIAAINAHEREAPRVLRKFQPVIRSCLRKNG
jgi:hypothetical protein